MMDRTLIDLIREENRELFHWSLDHCDLSYTPHMPWHSPVVMGSRVFGANFSKSITSSGTQLR